jgi:hypothetical protein
MRQTGGATPVDAYRELGVDEGAPLDEISRAYRRLVHDFHPDIHQDDPAASDRLRAIVRARDLILSSLRHTHREYGGRDDAVPDDAVRDVTTPDVAVHLRGAPMYFTRQPDLVAGPVMYTRASNARGTDGR